MKCIKETSPTHLRHPARDVHHRLYINTCKHHHQQRGLVLLSLLTIITSVESAQIVVNESVVCVREGHGGVTLDGVQLITSIYTTTPIVSNIKCSSCQP